MNKIMMNYSVKVFFMVMVHCFILNAENDMNTTTIASGANSIAVGKVQGDVVINTYITQSGTILLGNLFDDALSTAKTLVAKFLYDNQNQTNDLIKTTQYDITLLNNCLYDVFENPNGDVSILKSNFAKTLKIELLQKSMPQLQGLHSWYTGSAFVSKNSAASRLFDLEQKALGLVVMQSDFSNNIKSQQIISVKTILNSLVIGSSSQDTAQGNMQNVLVDTLVTYDDCVKASQCVALLFMGLTSTYMNGSKSYFGTYFPRKLYDVLKDIINNNIIVPKAIDLAIAEALVKAQRSDDVATQLKQLTEAEIIAIKTQVAIDVENKLKMN